MEDDGLIVPDANNDALAEVRWVEWPLEENLDTARLSTSLKPWHPVIEKPHSRPTNWHAQRLTMGSKIN
jgi:hypothetical protein